MRFLILWRPEWGGMSRGPFLRFQIKLQLFSPTSILATHTRTESKLSQDAITTINSYMDTVE